MIKLHKQEPRDRLSRFDQPWESILRAVGAVAASFATAAANAAVPAFPGAQGGGAVSAGGRGGAVILVTNLNDVAAGEPGYSGSLRAAVEASGPRTVVFRVGGEILLASELRITNPFITIAGQTAPGGGITLKGPDKVLQMVVVGPTAHDTIIRYIRIRKGYAGYPCNDPKTEGCGQNLTVLANNVMIDHVSSSWNQDEGLSAQGDRQRGVSNVTFSYNIQAEALRSHSTAFWVGGGSPLLVTDIDFHHNLVMTHSHRVPLAKGGSGRFVNNLIYNGRLYFIRVGGGMQLDVIANTFKKGSMTGARFFHEISGYENTTGAANYGAPGAPSIYLSGNRGYHQSDPAGDQWLIAHASPPLDENGIEIGPVPSGWRRDAPLADTTYPIVAEPVANIEASILPTVGASRRLACDGTWVANRDSVDARLVAEYETDTGRTSPPVTEADVGGYPRIAPGTPCADADSDGMPDVWEKANGLNPNNAADGNIIAANGYTNLENYLNGVTTTSAPARRGR
ncbi:MAG: hypothetical protein ACREH8_17165 [Opitutaceae bacterium]